MHLNSSLGVGIDDVIGQPSAAPPTCYPYCRLQIKVEYQQCYKKYDFSAHKLTPRAEHLSTAQRAKCNRFCRLFVLLPYKQAVIKYIDCRTLYRGISVLNWGDGHNGGAILRNVLAVQDRAITTTRAQTLTCT